jgi:hypothetical protein
LLLVWLLHVAAMHKFGLWFSWLNYVVVVVSVSLCVCVCVCVCVCERERERLELGHFFRNL